MNIKKKIVIVISIISLLILCISTSTFAYENGDIIPYGTVIQFPIDLVTTGKFIRFDFSSNGRIFTNISSNNSKVMTYNNPDDTNVTVYNVTWVDDNYRSITLTSDYIYTGNANDEYFFQYVINPPPHIEPSFWETVSGFFSEVLTSGTAIVNWMTNTPIALIPLALYCLIVIIAITKRMIKG